jgi:hypothetical protein
MWIRIYCRSMNLYNCSEQNASVRENFLVENTLTICILTIANNDKEGKIYFKNSELGTTSIFR